MKPIDILIPGRQMIIDANQCVICGGDAKEFNDALSVKEYGISGMCQKCQDRIFVEPKDPCEECKDKGTAFCKNECPI